MVVDTRSLYLINGLTGEVTLRATSRFKVIVKAKQFSSSVFSPTRHVISVLEEFNTVLPAHSFFRAEGRIGYSSQRGAI